MTHRYLVLFAPVILAGGTLALTAPLTNSDHSTLITQPTRPPSSQPPRRRGQVTEIPEHAVEITTDDTWRRISANGVPDHPTGDFPNRNNPNAIAIAGQDYDYRVPANPAPADDFTPMDRQPFGVAINGVPFDPGTAENYNNDPNTGWRLEGFNSVFNLGLDDSNAHVQPNGAYHYHGVPNALLNNLKDSADDLELILLGYAADGFPIYNAVGHQDPEDAESPLIALTPSYTLKEGDRDEGENTPPGEYNGDYTRDWEFLEDHGSLDQANATFGLTPEFPEGTYYYCVTEAFPYVPRMWRAAPDASFERRSPRDRLDPNRPTPPRRTTPPRRRPGG